MLIITTSKQTTPANAKAKMRIGEFHQKQYDDDIRWVTQVAKSIKDENPDVDISWSECIRLAEKYLRESKR